MDIYIDVYTKLPFCLFLWQLLNFFQTQKIAKNLCL